MNIRSCRFRQGTNGASHVHAMLGEHQFIAGRPVTGDSTRNSIRNCDVDDLQLDKLSVKELEELKSNVDTAIRAAIRQRAEIRARPMGAAAAPQVKVVDLERERDAWMAAKRQGKPI
jgi:hypothetical protein